MGGGARARFRFRLRQLVSKSWKEKRDVEETRQMTTSPSAQGLQATSRVVSAAAGGETAHSLLLPAKRQQSVCSATSSITADLLELHAAHSGLVTGQLCEAVPSSPMINVATTYVQSSCYLHYYFFFYLGTVDAAGAIFGGAVGSMTAASTVLYCSIFPAAHQTKKQTARSGRQSPPAAYRWGRGSDGCFWCFRLT